jgi:hypothetical protein
VFFLSGAFQREAFAAQRPLLPFVVMFKLSAARPPPIFEVRKRHHCDRLFEQERKPGRSTIERKMPSKSR